MCNGLNIGLGTEKFVIFTADDFGLSDALNGAVGLAHRQGLLQCASIMASAPRTREAILLARQMPDLCLGVHLTLIQGRAVLPPKHLPHLVNSKGFFSDDPVHTGWRYFSQPCLLPEIRRELAAQIELIQRADLKIWHLNSHLNLHLHPSIFQIVVDLARQYGIPAMRLPREDWRTTLALAPDHPLPKVVQGLIFGFLCRRAKKIARSARLLFNDHLFGLLNDGRMTTDYLISLVPRLQKGITEIYCHPGLYPDSELLRWAPLYRRQEEMTALINPGLMAALAADGVQVTDYRELSRSRMLSDQAKAINSIH